MNKFFHKPEDVESYFNNPSRCIVCRGVISYGLHLKGAVHCGAMCSLQTVKAKRKITHENAKRAAQIIAAGASTSPLSLPEVGS